MSFLEVEKAVLPHIHFVLPVLYIACSFLLSRFLRFSFAFVLFIGFIPYALQRFQLPFSEIVEQHHPLILTACLWGVVTAILLGLVLARMFASLIKAGSSLLGALLWVGACVALAFATVLVVNPTLLNSQLPDWKSAYGVILFGFAATACALALFKFAKASAFIAVWGVVCVILGAELFFNTLPSELLDKALTANDALLASTDSLPGSAAESEVGENALRIAMLGSTSIANPGYSKDAAYPAVLERYLNSSATDPEFVIKNYAKAGNSIVQLKDFVSENAFDVKPDIALISGWYEDSKKALNSLGMPGLTELEAHDQLDTKQWLSTYPALKKIFDSKTYKAVSLFLSGRPDKGEIENPVRVPAEEYSEIMKETLVSLKEKDITPVVVHEPVEKNLEEKSKEYLEATLKVANELKVPVIMLKDVLDQYGRDKLFLSENKLSAKGHQVVGESVFEALGMIAGSLDIGPEVKTAFADATNYPAKRFVQSFPTAEIGEELSFNVALPEDRTGYYKASFSVNDIPVKSKKLNTTERVELSFPFPEEARKSPFATVSLQLAPSHGLNSDYIGTNIPVPTKLRVSANGVENTIISGDAGLVSGEKGVIARLNPKNGTVERSMPLELGEKEITKFIKSSPWGHLVAIAASDASQLKDYASPGAFNYVGLKDTNLEQRPVAFVGVAGAKVSEVKAQPNFAKLKFGSKKFSRFSRMRVDSVSSQGKTLYSR